MPSKSTAQHRLMEGIAHGSIKPGNGKPSVAVARDFALADIGRKFAPPSKSKETKR